MVAENRIPPHAVFEPERCVQQRVILRDRADLEPDSPQAVQRGELRAGHVAIVVPKQCSVEGGQVGQNSGEENQRITSCVRKTDRTGNRTFHRRRLEILGSPRPRA